MTQKVTANHFTGSVSEYEEFRNCSLRWAVHASKLRYVHQLTWLGRPILQVPNDIYAVQELVWKLKPDLIIETGIAFGGSLILSASMLALLDYCEAKACGNTELSLHSKRKVIGVDIEIRPHNRSALEQHPLRDMIDLIEGSSVESNTIKNVIRSAAGFKRVMVMLDSNHTHEHVLAELKAYAPLVSKGSYCVVWDAGIEELPAEVTNDRPWGKGNNPQTALLSFLEELRGEHQADESGELIEFDIDLTLETRIMITSARMGFLRRL